MKDPTMKRFAVSVCTALLAIAGAQAKLPPPTPEAKAAADQAKAKSDWTDKVGAYKLCQSMNRVAEGYFKSAKAKGLETHSPTPTPPCTEPGPFVDAGAASSPKPLEQSGAHSPAETAKSPPSSQATQSQLPSKKQ
jgi:hypothetical protein